MKTAICQEHQLGLHRPPVCEFSIYFSIGVETLLTRGITFLQVWLRAIRLGRELDGGIDIIQDEYFGNEPFQSWLGVPVLKFKKKKYFLSCYLP